ncbi:Cyclin [Ceraceosorus bombacis]|uniref:Cyclin n=1 Tax=Ceraceosorus bombacis TaxID=401625 RepID=A0A0P1BNC9_9BASI|nr:Cyclin [Ceraceosorus bombacis]
MATAATSWPQSAIAPQQASCSRSNSSARSSSRKTSRGGDYCDRFYGHQELAELCERVISALFACPLDSTSSCTSSSSSQRVAPRLSEFIAYALHRTRLPLAVTHQALFLLKRLKSRFPAARGSSGHRLFISALMLASKSSCDDTYSNKSWTIVGQGLFSLREVNQMERELFGYLGYKVNVENEDLVEFVQALDEGVIPMPSPPAPTVAPVAPAPTAMPAEPQEPALSQQHSSASASVVRHGRASIAGYPVGPATCPAAVGHASAPTGAAPHLTRSQSVSGRQSYRSQSAAPTHHYQQQSPFDARESSRPYTTPTHNVSLSVAAAAAAHTAAFYSHVAPSAASLASSRGSISSSSGSSEGYDSTCMTPGSCGDSAYSSSGRTTPDTPPSEVGGSPWMNDKAHLYWDQSGEPAGTYDSHVKQYHDGQTYDSQNAASVDHPYVARGGAPGGHPYTTW